MAALPEAPEMICLWRKEGISSSQIEGKHFQASRAARLVYNLIIEEEGRVQTSY